MNPHMYERRLTHEHHSCRDMKKRESEEGKFATKAGVFLLHDATIKDRASVLHTAARCELQDPESGEITIVNCPIKFDLLKDGSASTERRGKKKRKPAATCKSKTDSLATTVSGTSVSAARLRGELRRTLTRKMTCGVTAK